MSAQMKGRKKVLTWRGLGLQRGPEWKRGREWKTGFTVAACIYYFRALRTSTKRGIEFLLPLS